MHWRFTHHFCPRFLGHASGKIRVGPLRGALFFGNLVKTTNAAARELLSLEAGVERAQVTRALASPPGAVLVDSTGERIPIR